MLPSPAFGLAKFKHLGPNLGDVMRTDLAGGQPPSAFDEPQPYANVIHEPLHRLERNTDGQLLQPTLALLSVAQKLGCHGTWTVLPGGSELVSRSCARIR